VLQHSRDGYTHFQAMQRDFTVLLPPAHRSSYTNKDQETMHRIRDPTFMIGTDKHTCLEEAAAIGRCECIESDCSESSANIRGPMFMNLDNSFEHVHQNLGNSYCTESTSPSTASAVGPGSKIYVRPASGQYRSICQRRTPSCASLRKRPMNACCKVMCA